MYSDLRRRRPVMISTQHVSVSNSDWTAGGKERQCFSHKYCRNVLRSRSSKCSHKQLDSLQHGPMIQMQISTLRSNIHLKSNCAKCSQNWSQSTVCCSPAGRKRKIKSRNVAPWNSRMSDVKQQLSADPQGAWTKAGGCKRDDPVQRAQNRHRN